LVKKIIIVKIQQLILGTGTAIWWLTEPHCHLDELPPNPFISFLSNIKQVIDNLNKYFTIKML
jgi:hypothetical protein